MKKQIGLVPKTVLLLLLFTVGVCLHLSLIKKPDNYQVYVNAADNIFYQQNLYAKYGILDYFKYSPLAALMIVPFSLLIDEVGMFLFLFLQYWLFFWGFWRWAKAAGFPLEQSSGMMLVAFVSIVSDSILAIQICQVNAGIFGLMLLAAAQYSEKKHVRSGLLLSLAVNLKIFPFTLALCYLAGFKKRFWMAFWIGLALWFLLPAAFIGADYNFELLGEWYKLMTWDQTRNLEMLDIGNFLELHFGISQAVRNPLAILVGLLIGAGTLYLFRKNRTGLIDSFLLPVNGLYVLLFSYLSESATSILATPAIFLIGMEAFKEKIRARLYWLFWALALFLIPVFYSDLVLKSWSWWARGFHLKTVGYVYISVVMGILFAKRYKKSLC
ncbi:MAG: glycosyltransferase family 87 protein [Candidatus Aminicenantes bacterium]|jgi:hypothetical protein